VSRSYARQSVDNGVIAHALASVATVG